MNIKDLQYYVAVAELEHFGQAAERCFVSQPTLSGQVKKLEEQLGITLLERTNRKVMLTETGEEIANVARRILHEVDIIEDIARSRRDPFSGKFRLAAFPTLASYIFPGMVPKIKRSMPKLQLILIEEKTAELTAKLRSGEIDAAFLALPSYDDFLVSHKLFDDEFLLAVPPGHALSKSSTVNQSMLSAYSLLLLEEGHCLRDQALELCSLHSIPQESDFKATSLETLRQMVKAGTGITLMPKIAINGSERDINFIPFEDPAPVRSIGLVWRKTTARIEVIQELIPMIT